MCWVAGSVHEQALLLALSLSLSPASCESECSSPTPTGVQGIILPALTTQSTETEHTFSASLNCMEAFFFKQVFAEREASMRKRDETSIFLLLRSDRPLLEL